MEIHAAALTESGQSGRDSQQMLRKKNHDGIRRGLEEDNFIDKEIGEGKLMK